MRVLIIGQDYFHYLSSLVRACQSLGHEVLKVSTTKFAKQKGNYWNRKSFKAEMKSMESKYYQAMNLELIKTAKTFKPDICIMINGDNIMPDFSVYLKEHKILTRLFMLDSVQEDFFQPPWESLIFFDKIFSYEPSDLEFLADKHPAVEYLFVGYDRSLFYPLKEIPLPLEKYDICFVGSLYSSRLELLERVASYAHSHNRKMIVHTKNRHSKQDFWHVSRNFFRDIKFKIHYPYLDQCLIDVPLYNEQLTEIYQKSKICINMHAGKNNKSHTGPNPRTFEILGCKAFQLIDAGYLDDIHLETGRHLVEYQDAEQLCKNIDYYLDHEEERRKIATACYECVKEEYTMEECAKKLLEL